MSLSVRMGERRTTFRVHIAPQLISVFRDDDWAADDGRAEEDANSRSHEPLSPRVKRSVQDLQTTSYVHPRERLCRGDVVLNTHVVDLGGLELTGTVNPPN